jgi:predicted cupin superfamily sugar epimerase
MAADELIKKLELVPYPSIVCKNFYFKELYRSDLKVKPLSDEREERNAFTTIYFLVKQVEGEYGMWRRLKSDETFFYHKGNPMRIAVIKPDGKLEDVLVGDRLQNEQARYNYTFPAKSWFNFCLGHGDADYGLFSGAVAPGFDYDDVEVADVAKLAAEFPQHKSIIEEFTNK